MEIALVILKEIQKAGEMVAVKERKSELKSERSLEMKLVELVVELDLT